MPVNVDGPSCGPAYFNFPNPYSCGDLGFSSFSGSNYLVYPNPASSQINIAITTNNKTLNKEQQTITQLKLYNFTGNPLIEKKNGDLKNLNVSHLEDGMYYLEITSDNNNKEIHRIIIDK